MSKVRTDLIAALDIGSSKMCCLIARAEDGGGLRVLGAGQHRSRGIRGGLVVDMDAAEESLRAAVDAAEGVAGERIDRVVVNVAGGQTASENVEVEMPINGHGVTETEMRRILDYARHHNAAPERSLIHAIPVGYTVDAADGIRDPRGMFGDKLGVAMHLISAAAGPVRNLVTVVERAHLDIEARVFSGYASGLACLVEDETELGVTCIDMGGGTTSIAVFVENQLVHTACLPVGGTHVTNDIARALSTPLAQAERVKTLYGSAQHASADDREILKVPLVGEEDEDATNPIPRSVLVQVIQPRVEETFELVRAELETSGFDKLAGRRVVLTGGGSQLEGVRDLAELVLDKQVRLGRPLGLRGTADAASGPAFSTCAGLLRYAVLNADTAVTAQAEAPGGRLARLGQWLRTHF